MPKKVEIDAFKINELKGYAKEKATEWARQAATDHEWWDYVYEHWVEKLKEKGIDTDTKQIFFSGFWSQGDGACFTGTIDLPKFMLAHEMVGEHLELYAEAVSDDADMYVRLERSRGGGNYSHSNTVVVADNCLELEVEEGIIAICRKYMDELYKDLEAEYESLITDEALQEMCEANDWMFDEDGRKI